MSNLNELDLNKLKKQELVDLLEQIKTNDKNASEKTAKRKAAVKNLTITGLVILLLGAGHHLALEKNKSKNLTSKPTNTQTQTQGNEWTKEDFNNLVIDYMYNNPTVTEEAARYFLAIQYQEELMENNPELLYELTGIYEYEELTTEKFETLVSNTFKTLRNQGIDVTVEDVTKFVAIINIDQLAQDNPELLKTIIGTGKASEIIADAFKITGAIKNRNYDIYASTKSTKNLIKVSDFIFDKKAKADLQLIEEYVDLTNAAKGNKDRQNALVSELMAEIQTPNGRLVDMEDGIGFASTVAFDNLINYVTFNDNNVRIISNQNFSALMNHDTLELYLSNIYGTINECNTKKLTK